MRLMIVESPNKAPKIREALGDGWQVAASAGHIRDLPRKSLGVEEGTFALQYEFIPPREVNGKTYPGGQERTERLKALADKASVVFLATDPDREGEAIAWHLKEALGLSESDYQRVTFNAITESAIQNSLAGARRIDMELVNAQEARRALDRLVGYMVSPVLSDKAGQSLSAGRVQSVALRLIVDRERAINAFKPTTHFGARLEMGGWSVFWDRGLHTSEDSPYVLDRNLAERAAAMRDCEVLAYTESEAKRAPPSPLSTSLMLQEASNKLNFPPEKITTLAQRLFEQGHVTYIRTDSVNITDEAAAEIKAYAISQGLPVADKVRRWKSKEGAQEAHEAIRPTHVEIKDAGSTDEEKALYRLIWVRAVGSQLADALYDAKEARLSAGEFQFLAKGQSMKFAGWKSLQSESSGEEDEDEEGEQDQAGIPALVVGQSLSAESGEVYELVTRAPARYTVASLTTKLESEGIGRPATYAAIMQNITQRGYVFMKGKAFMPSPIGEFVVDQLVAAQFGFMDLAFTRSMEESLDHIAQGNANYTSVVKPAHESLLAEIANVKANALLKPLFPCPECQEGLKRFKRKDQTAYFWKCQGEECGTFFDDKNGQPIAQKHYQCPRCESALRRWQRKDKDGFYWACSNKECKTILNDERSKPQKAVPCSSCDGLLTRRKGDNGFWWGCTGYKNGCKTTAKDKRGKPDFDNGKALRIPTLKLPTGTFRP